MGWVAPIAFFELCEWPDSMAMHQADVIVQAGGTIGDSLWCVLHAHGSLAWILGYHFRSLGAKDGYCSCLAWPFSAPPEQLRLRHGTN
jgi:hypothetical protein